MITYRNNSDGITEKMLDGFFVDWPNKPSASKHLQILNNCHSVVLAVDDEKDRVIGFITAISDGILTAHIPLLEVRPEYQGKGVGQELVQRMLAELKDFYDINLICDAELQPFYETIGMRRTQGMMIRNYNRQSG